MKNKITDFTWGYSAKHYLTHPWKWFKHLFWNIKDFIHRGKHGFARSDVWNMDEYLLEIIPQMLRYLAKHGCGYPGVEPFKTEGEYNKWLINLAEKFENCQMDDEDWDSKNEYANLYHEMSLNALIRSDTQYTTEEITIRNKYFDRMLEIGNEVDRNVLEAYTELAKYHNNLYD